MVAVLLTLVLELAVVAVMVAGEEDALTGVNGINGANNRKNNNKSSSYDAGSLNNGDSVGDTNDVVVASVDDAEGVDEEDEAQTSNCLFALIKWQ
ncbi:hypothetical protein DFQ28_000187 [Apophysomyces sp. BC1034]|nr:hypothetical protein DFQ28_000187 [Apophysomyces sp. BC1034]